MMSIFTLILLLLLMQTSNEVSLKNLMKGKVIYSGAEKHDIGWSDEHGEPYKLWRQKRNAIQSNSEIAEPEQEDAGAEPEVMGEVLTEIGPEGDSLSAETKSESEAEMKAGGTIEGRIEPETEPWSQVTGQSEEEPQGTSEFEVKSEVAIKTEPETLVEAASNEAEPESASTESEGANNEAESGAESEGTNNEAESGAESEGTNNEAESEGANNEAESEGANHEAGSESESANNVAESEPESESANNEAESESANNEAESESESQAGSDGEGETESEPEEEVRPKPYEIIIPPLSLMIIIVLGLVGLAVWSKRKVYFKSKLAKAAVTPEGMDQSVVDLKQFFRTKRNYAAPKENIVAIKEAEAEAESGKEEFFTDFDLEVLGSLGSFNSRPVQLARVSFPALLSLALCPFTLYLYEPLTSFFWPADRFKVLPDINEAIACFLAPAGLVYATSFGFAFQSALSKQQAILDKITHEFGLIDQIVTLCAKITLPSLEHRMMIYKAVKCEAIFTTLQIMNTSPENFVNKPQEDVSIRLWDVLDILRKVTKTATGSLDLDQILVNKIVSHILELNSICSDRMGMMHARIHPLKWAFLESLGFFSFFGILLIQTQSYRTELTMCIITVFSISLLCFVVSDLDSPFCGFFRVELSVLPEVVMRIKKAYELAKQGEDSLVSYPEKDCVDYD